MGRPNREPAYTLSSRGKRDGPFTEAELILMAREGRIHGDDLLRAEGEAQWTRASRVPWLGDVEGQPLKERGTPLWILVVAFLMLLGALLGVLAVQRDADRTAEVIDLGVVLAPRPDPATAIPTEAWGLVPPNRIHVRFHPGASRAAIEGVATAVGGTIVGELPLLELYVLDVPADTERGLQAVLALAQAQRGVRFAFPEQIAFLARDGREWTFADSAVYAGGRARSLEMIGLQSAWNMLRASGVRLQAVQVGLLDTGVHLAHGAFDTVRISAPGARDRLAEARTDANGQPLVHYSHGTAVASVIAGGQAEGVVGVASMLGSRLQVRVKAVFHDGFTTHPDGAQSPPGAYAIASLAHIQRQIEQGARIVNLSWCLGVDPVTGGFRDVHVGVYRAYRDFFRRIGRRHPDVVFVCSAGNQGGTPDDEGFAPGGLALPNVITVGNVDGVGRARPTRTNTTSPGRAFHVDLAAPGQGVVYGVGPDGRVASGDGGTSMAVALVTGTIALMRAVEPGLTAADVKELLVASARTTMPSEDGPERAIPAAVGGRCLAADRAVLTLLDRRRAALGEDTPLEADAFRDLTRIELVAEREDGVDGERWRVEASVPRTVRATTTLTLVPCEGAVVGGASEVVVTADQVARWTVEPAEDRRIEVRRSDTGARWIVDLAP